MRTETKTIGQDLTIFDYSTRQKGYGRQALYLSFLEVPGEFYIMDVFPNVKEDFGILLKNDAFYDEEKGCYTDEHGNREHTAEEVFYTVEDALNYYLSSKEVEIKQEKDGDDE